jgi:SNF2 family DNA or RNA helicase
MKWLVINTEAFSARGLKQKKAASFEDLPWVVRKFLSAFPVPFIILDESSKIKTNIPMKETNKSSRTRTIKLLNKFGERCIMTGTVKSKSPLNVIDQYNFLKEDYFPESMWEFAEHYCIMETIRIGRGRRVLISQKDYADIRKRLKNAWIRGGEEQLKLTKESIFKQYTIDYQKQEHIIQHRKYSPFINQAELLRRIAPVTMFVKREDVFDIRFDKFIKEPIMRPITLSERAKSLANELIDLGFTESFTLGKAPALELIQRLQDVCNGFEPVEHREMKMIKGALKEVRTIESKPLPENPKLDALIELLEEIDVDSSQVVIWSSRKSLLNAVGDRLTKEGITFVLYDGSASSKEKMTAQDDFYAEKTRVFLANQASGAYGLNCLAKCNYMVWMCIDGSVEKYIQAMSRLLRGKLNAPKFAYVIYVKKSVEERMWEAIRVGKELVEESNTKEKFIFV